jgi:hypothetical protein
MTGSEPEADGEGGTSIDEPGMILMEKPGPEDWGEIEAAIDDVGIAVEEPGAMGRAELVMDDEDTS